MNFTNIILKYSSTCKALYFEWYRERARVKYNKKSNCKAFWVYANAHQNHSCTFLTPLVLVTWLFQEAESQSFVSRYAMFTVYRKSFKPLSIPQELLKKIFQHWISFLIFHVPCHVEYIWVTVRPIDA